MINKIKEILTNSNGKIIPRRITESYFKKNYPELLIEINKLFNNDLSLQAKIYMLYYNIAFIPKCPTCGGDVKFAKFSCGFYKYCSNKCVCVNSEIIKQKEETMLKNHGVKYTFQSEKLRKQIKETCFNLYGDEFPQKTDLIKEKVVETNIKNWGVTHPSKLRENKEKRKRTNLKVFGYENPQQSPVIKDKTKQTNVLLYGFESPMSNETIKDKVKKTNLDRYNATCSLQSVEIRDKYEKENIVKFGYKTPSKNDVVRLKMSKSLDVTLTEKSINHWVNKLNLNVGDVKIIDGDAEIKNYCKKHSTFMIDRGLLSNRIKNGIENICTLCNPINENVSIKENEIKDFIENNLYVSTIKHKINNKEIDIFIPTHNVGIEFDGLYWHSDKFKNNRYHIEKTELCEKNNVYLLHIFEDEWIFKKNIVKSLIKSKLKIFDEEINSKNCYVKEVDFKTSTNFISENHILENVFTKINLGIFYKNDLVSVMTFRETSLGEYEIMRHCNLLNVKIINNVSLFINYFKFNYKPKMIWITIDRRFSQGEDYKEIGFNITENTKPNFYYILHKNPIKYNRYSFRKKILVKEGFDSNKTVNEIMKERGYVKIYDSGTTILKNYDF